MIPRLLRYVTLPREVSEFEAAYLRRTNRIALWFFWLHVPTFPVIAKLAHASVLEAVLLTLGVMIAPTIAYLVFPAHPRRISCVFAVTAMLLGGVLVYFHRGPMQIEMHFYYFVLIALLVVFANPSVILAAAVTVAVHHLVLWFAMPSALFNYAASWWSMLVHAIFLVLESIAACFVARSFFDNVIGLERIVQQRTEALAERKRDMALILDNVGQGFATVAYDGTIGAERSRALDAWFGAPAPGARWWDYVASTAEERAWIQLGFEGLVDDVMPLAATLDQLPKRATRDGKVLAFEYRPIGDQSLLVVVTDVTSEVARLEAERTQHELMVVLEKSGHDRAGFAAFMREARELVGYCAEPASDLATLRRYLHTLKGNASLFGAASIAEIAHVLETELEHRHDLLVEQQRRALAAAWIAFEGRVAPLGVTQQRSVIVEREEFDAVVDAIDEAVEKPAPDWTVRIFKWGLDPARPHLERLAEQATLLAARLEKPELVTHIDDGDTRLDGTRFQPLWSALVHAVRNAIYHGIESSEVRRRAGKPERATLALLARVADNTVVIEVRDDGAGIDWERIADKAQERGLPAATRRDLIDALFSGGVSTADGVSDVAGRGVGLDALRTVCRCLGGDVVIESERGRGTRVRCIVNLTDRKSLMTVARASA